jgi:hypothetical protein
MEGTANLENVPAGVLWTCVTAKDKLHTLSSKVSLGTGTGSPIPYTASFAGTGDALIGGDVTNDNKIDILDFGAFVGQWGWSLVAPGCSWSGRHSDISGNETVGVEDFTFIQIGFLTKGESLCDYAASVSSVGEDEPRTWVSVRELARIIGLRDAMNADLNKDGMVDLTDVKLFLRQVYRR